MGLQIYYDGKFNQEFYKFMSENHCSDFDKEYY